MLPGQTGRRPGSQTRVCRGWALAQLFRGAFVEAGLQSSSCPYRQKRRAKARPLQIPGVRPRPPLPKQNRKGAPPAIWGRLGPWSVRLRQYSSPWTFPQRSPITQASLVSNVWGRGRIRRPTPFVARDQQVIHFRCAGPAHSQPGQIRGRIALAW